MTNQSLESLRKQIDTINVQILKLLNERTEIVESIGNEKQKLGLKVHDPIREQQIIQKLCDVNQGPMTEQMVKEIFEIIFKTSVHYQELNNMK